MVIGDPSVWIQQFRSLDERLLQCIASIWPKCLDRLSLQPEEDEITINLVDILSKDRDALRLFHWIEFQFESFGYSASGAAYSKGKIDMAVFLDQDREKYLAYECKRLNVVNKGSRKSLATDYVKDGVKRFVTEQYAEHLPIGSMLGYVMDGDVPFAQSKVQAALDANKEEVNLVSGPTPTDFIAFVRRFRTRHRKETVTHNIEIHHALLPYLPMWKVLQMI